MDHSQGICLRI